MWLLSTWNVTSTSEELNFEFYFILINCDLSSYILLMATMWHSTVLEDSQCPLIEQVVSKLEKSEHIGKHEKATG